MALPECPRRERVSKIRKCSWGVVAVHTRCVILWPPWVGLEEQASKDKWMCYGRREERKRGEGEEKWKKYGNRKDEEESGRSSRKEENGEEEGRREAGREKKKMRETERQRDRETNIDLLLSDPHWFLPRSQIAAQ